MYCTQCGRQNPASAQFCSGCGKRLAIDSQNPALSSSGVHTLSCYIHASQAAIGVCVSCGQAICGECRVPIQGKNYCKRCSAELASRFSSASRSGYPQQKNSGIAVVLSFFWMGLGQLYNGQIGKGVLLMILEIVILFFGFLTLIVLIGFFILFAGFILWVWNLYDAYNTAERINRGEIVT
jgi:TM2 domain-containing membrane protein YozV